MSFLCALLLLQAAGLTCRYLCKWIQRPLIFSHFAPLPWPWLSRGCSSAAPSKDLGRLTDYRRSSRPFCGFLSRDELPARPSPTLSVIDVVSAHLHLLYMQGANRTFWLFFPSLSLFLSLSAACTTFRGLKTDDGVRGTRYRDKTSIFFNASRLDPSVPVPQHWDELGDQF